MYMSKEDLLKIAKDHKLRGCVNYTKSQLVDRLQLEGFLPEGVNKNDKKQDRYTFIKRIRGGSKQVAVTDSDNGDVQTYPSIYACAKALNVNPGSIRFFNGRKYLGRYDIKILEEDIK